MKTRHTPMWELNLGQIGFRLVGEIGSDAEKIVAEREAARKTREAAAAFAAAFQRELLTEQGIDSAEVSR